MPRLVSNDYHSYLLRMWRVKDNDTFHWRVTLEQVDSGVKYSFNSLEALMAFLEQTAQLSAGLSAGEANTE